MRRDSGPWQLRIPTFACPAGSVSSPVAPPPFPPQTCRRVCDWSVQSIELCWTSHASWSCDRWSCTRCYCSNRAAALPPLNWQTAGGQQQPGQAVGAAVTRRGIATRSGASGHTKLTPLGEALAETADRHVEQAVRERMLEIDDHARILAARCWLSSRSPTPERGFRQLAIPPPPFGSVGGHAWATIDRADELLGQRGHGALVDGRGAGQPGLRRRRPTGRRPRPRTSGRSAVGIQPDDVLDLLDGLVVVGRRRHRAGASAPTAPGDRAVERAPRQRRGWGS